MKVSGRAGSVLLARDAEGLLGHGIRSNNHDFCAVLLEQMASRGLLQHALSDSTDAPLIAAAQQPDAAMLVSLILQRMNNETAAAALETKDNSGRTALMHAIKTNDALATTALLSGDCLLSHTRMSCYDWLSV